MGSTCNQVRYLKVVIKVSLRFPIPFFLCLHVSFKQHRLLKSIPLQVK